MRIIDEINRGLLKITIFKMNEKISMKFEKNSNEITIKFRDGSGVDEDEDVKKFLDTAIIDKYENLLDSANETKIDQLIKLEGDKGFVFPKII
jgi:hypothetical protein